LAVEDRILLHLHTDDPDLAAAIKEHTDTIAAETLTAQLKDDLETEHHTIVKVDGAELAIGLVKAP
jgi:hypothetical protein